MGNRHETDKKQLPYEKEDTLIPEDVLILLTDIFQALADYPDDIKVTHSKGDRTHVFTVSSNRADVGKIIGKNGRMISGVRTILLGISARAGARSVLDVED